MRDPERIDRMIEILRAYWRCYPDMRLGQIVENAKSYATTPTDAGVSTFHIEDDAIERGLRVMIRR